MWSVFANIVCNKRGQTSRPAVGNAIQTSCNFKWSVSEVIAFWAMSILAAAMYFSNYLMTLSHGYIIVSDCITISILSYTKIF